MRDIKFRAWNGEQMQQVTLLELQSDFEKDPCVYNINLPNQDEEKVTHYSDVNLMQYTGLNDKNGVEIYEGDIVKTSQFDQPALINWIDFLAQFAVEIREYYDDEHFNFNFNSESLDPDAEIEVIGNIYENPELLEEA